MYLNELWINAMNELKKDRSMFNTDDIFNLITFISDYERVMSEDIINQIERDIRIYPKYDAIAMWLGDGGLIDQEPEFITELIGLFGIKKED